MWKDHFVSNLDWKVDKQTLLYFILKILENNNNERRERLFKVISEVLSRNPTIKYYQVISSVVLSYLVVLGISWNLQFILGSFWWIRCSMHSCYWEICTYQFKWILFWTFWHHFTSIHRNGNFYCIRIHCGIG